ncbi:MAG: DUF4249 domain-containing protein [Bacteroidales bacterium]
MKIYILRLSDWLIITLILSSCTKVIDIDLNSASPQLVIEGNISDLPGPYSVRLSKTVNFNKTNLFPPASGAIVKISDNTGNSEILTETSPGLYSTSLIQGTPGRTYTLTVTYEEKIYEATSTMPYGVYIDTLTIQEFCNGIQGAATGKIIAKYINVQFYDPSEISNYYRFIQIFNGVPQDDIFLIDDQLQNGQTISNLLAHTRNNFQPGDTVTVLLQRFDKGVYEYFRTLSQLRSAELSSSPSNPLSNFNNGALGYFSAYSLRSKTIVIP